MKVEILKKIIYGRQCITINVHFGFLTFYDKFVHILIASALRQASKKHAILLEL